MVLSSFPSFYIIDSSSFITLLIKRLSDNELVIYSSTTVYIN